MTTLQAAFLGAVQGLTEFLPVSSSGHLVLLQSWLKVTGPTFEFDILIHAATLLAVLVFFGRSLFKLSREEIIGVIIGTIPALIIGLLFKDALEASFGSINFVGVELMITGVIMAWADRKLPSAPATDQPLTWKKSLIIGIWQAVAIIPGISRSGSTVAGGIDQGLSREQAFRFSFLLSLPAIGGASLLEAIDVYQAGTWRELPLVPFAVGAVVAFVVGLLSLGIFRWVILKAKMEWFAWYCGILGAVVVISQLLS